MPYSATKFSTNFSLLAIFSAIFAIGFFASIMIRISSSYSLVISNQFDKYPSIITSVRIDSNSISSSFKKSLMFSAYISTSASMQSSIPLNMTLSASPSRFLYGYGPSSSLNDHKSTSIAFALFSSNFLEKTVSISSSRTYRDLYFPSLKFVIVFFSFFNKSAPDIACLFSKAC